MPPSPSRVLCSGSPFRRWHPAASRRCGARLSRRGRWRGGGSVMDFWFPLSVASGRHPLQCRRGVGERCAGAMVARLLWLAAGWRTMASVLGWWSVAGGSAAVSRHRRRERADLEVDVSLGAGPRLACHSDTWALCVLLLEVFKASWRWSVFKDRKSVV